MRTKPTIRHPWKAKFKQQQRDSVWPGEEAIEARWRAEGGIDHAGRMWLTPRMQRNADATILAWSTEPRL